VTTVSVTNVINTVTAVENGATIVVPVPETSVVIATTAGPQGPSGDGAPGNNDVGVIYLKNNAVATPIGSANARAVVAGAMQTGALYNFAKDATTNSLKYSGPGGKFHVVATFNFTTNSQNVCGFYVGHNTDDTTALNADADRISESEIYVNSSTTANQPVSGAIQSVLELQPDDRVFFIVQNRDAANNITVQFLKFTVTSLTAEKGDGILSGGNTGDLLIKASGSDYDTAWTDAPTVDKLGLDLTAAEAVTTGQLAWNATEGTVDIGLLNGATNQLGQETQLLCTNSTSTTTIVDGMGVMFTGSNATTLRLEVQPMDASGTLPGYVFFGVATETIAPGATGYVTTFGKVRGIDTSAYPEDSVLWCDPINAGQFVLTEPAAPRLKIAAATVIKSHPTDGVLMVRAETGQNLSDCHDVELNGGAFDTQYLGWSETYQRWQPYNVPNAAPRSITIAEPQIGDSFTLFRTSGETTITSAVALVSGGSVTYELRYAADRTTAGTLATASDIVTNTTTGDSATVQNQPIPSGRYVWVEITAVSGTVNEFNLSVAF
jgi:hypothetical protein